LFKWCLHPPHALKKKIIEVRTVDGAGGESMDSILDKEKVKE